MRRIYESEAVVRDDHPHTPRERDGERSRRAIDWDNASHALLPVRLRDWAIDVSVETDRGSYRVGDPVGVRVRFENRLPFPVRLRTETPLLWEWSVDGAPEASRVPERAPPDRRGVFSFSRSERKTFTRSWNQSIRETSREWVPVDPGEYTVAARVNVPDAPERGLSDETTLRIER